MASYIVSNKRSLSESLRESHDSIFSDQSDARNYHISGSEGTGLDAESEMLMNHGPDGDISYMGFSLDTDDVWRASFSRRMGPQSYGME